MAVSFPQGRLLYRENHDAYWPEVNMINLYDILGVYVKEVFNPHMIVYLVIHEPNNISSLPDIKYMIK